MMEASAKLGRRLVMQLKDCPSVLISPIKNLVPMCLAYPVKDKFKFLKHLVPEIQHRWKGIFHKFDDILTAGFPSHLSSWPFYRQFSSQISPKIHSFDLWQRCKTRRVHSDQNAFCPLSHKAIETIREHILSGVIEGTSRGNKKSRKAFKARHHPD